MRINPKACPLRLSIGPAFAPVPEPAGTNATATALMHRNQPTAFQVVSGSPTLGTGVSLVANGTSLLLSSLTPDLVINPGFGGEGIALEAGRACEGYVLVRVVPPAKPSSLRVLATLGAADVAITTAAGNFTITTSGGGTECKGISQRAADAAGVTCPVGNAYKGKINPAANI